MTILLEGGILSPRVPPFKGLSQKGFKMYITPDVTWGSMKELLFNQYAGDRTVESIGGVPVGYLGLMPDNQLFSDKTLPELPEQVDEEED